jgi:hypothetical protein
MKTNKAYTKIEVLIVLSILGSLIFSGFLVWLAFHFIQKIW